MREVKKIEQGAKSFSANGKTYYIEQSISISRYKKFEQLQLEVGFGMRFKDVFNVVRAAMEDLNKTKLVDAAVKLYNLNYGIQDESKKQPFVLRFCALFINEADENRSEISDDLIDAKIADWEKEGLDIEPFFQFATSSLKGLNEVSKNLTEI